MSELSSIVDRMKQTYARMQAAKRSPRVFFLTPDDYAAFVRTEPDYDWFAFHQGGKPSQQFCPRFRDAAVRASQSKVPIRSALFSTVGTSMTVKGWDE